jgi:hypothetical protein
VKKSAPNGSAAGTGDPPQRGKLDVEITEDFSQRVFRASGDAEHVTKVVEIVMDANQPFYRKHFGALAGIAFVAAALILAFTFDNPTPLQKQLILVTAALGGGGFSMEFAHRIKANLSLGQKLTVAAGGAAAVFVILYFFTPAGAG